MDTHGKTNRHTHAHVNTNTHSVGLFLNEWSAHCRGRYLHKTKKDKSWTSMTLTGYEPAIRAIRRPQTYAFDIPEVRIGRILRLRHFHWGGEILREHLFWYLYSTYFIILYSGQPMYVQLTDKLSNSSYMLRHYRVILRELEVSTLPSYTSMSMQLLVIQFKVARLFYAGEISVFKIFKILKLFYL